MTGTAPTSEEIDACHTVNANRLVGRIEASFVVVPLSPAGGLSAPGS